MEKINIESLKTGNEIMTYDANLRKWIKCKIIQVEKYLVTLEDIEGFLKGVKWYETIDRLKDPDYYRSVTEN